MPNSGHFKRGNGAALAMSVKDADLMRRLLLFWLLVLCCYGCVGVPESSTVPRVTGVSIAGKHSTPTPALVVAYDGEIALNMNLEESIALVADQVGVPCEVDLTCEEMSQGSCVVGRCQRSSVTQAWRSDLDTPPLSEGRRNKLEPIDTTVSGAYLVVEPKRPLAPNRGYTLVVGRHAGGGNGENTEFHFVTSERETGRPWPELISPHHGETGLPTNLKRLYVRWNRPVRYLADGAMWLSSERESHVVNLTIDAADALCREPGTCFKLTLAEELAPLGSYRLLWNERIVDDSGGGAFPGPSIRIASGPDRNDVVPRPVSSRVRVADGCLTWAITTAAPSDLVIVGSDGRRYMSIGTSQHMVASSEARSFEGRLENLAGHGVELATDVPTNAKVPRVVISEVLANPSGKEPAAEYVEILNRHPTAVSLGGWSIEDGPIAQEGNGSSPRILPDSVLLPGQRAVIVSETFQGIVDPKALTIRLTKSVGVNGLSNRGESVALRDPVGTLVSYYGGYVDTAGMDGTSVVRQPIDACDDPSVWLLNEAPTPGGA